MTVKIALLAAGVASFGAPGRAFDALTYGEFSLTFGGGANLTATRDGETARNAYGYLESTLGYFHSFGALTFGAEAYAEIEFQSDTEGHNLTVYDDPYIDVGLWLEGESFGYLSFSYDSSAVRALCIEAPSSGDNYGHADFMTVSACPSFDTRSVLYYKSPSFSGGYSIAASYMPQTKLENGDAGEASRSISVAVGYDAVGTDGAQ